MDTFLTSATFWCVAVFVLAFATSCVAAAAGSFGTPPLRHRRILSRVLNVAVVVMAVALGVIALLLVTRGIAS